MSKNETRTANVQQAVIVVDDQEDILEIYEYYLSSKGYRVVTAGSAEQALKQIPNCDPFLVITDFRMPVTNGADLCEMINRIHHGLPVVVLTGFDNEAIEALKAHQLDHFETRRKPISGEDLVQIVQRYQP